MTLKSNLKIGDTVRVTSVCDEDSELGIKVGDELVIQMVFPSYVLIRKAGYCSFYPLEKSQIQVVRTRGADE